MFVKDVTNLVRTSGFFGGSFTQAPPAVQLCGLVQGQKRHHIVPHSHSPVRRADPRVSPVLSAVGFSQEQGLCPCPRALPQKHMELSSSPHTISHCSDPNCSLPTAKGCPAHGAVLRQGPSSIPWLTALPEPWHCLGPWGPSLSSQGYPTEGWLWGKDHHKHLHSPCSRPACECWGCDSTCPKPTPHLPPAPSQHCCHPFTLPALSCSGLLSLPAPLQAGCCLPPSLIPLSLGRHGPLSRGDSPGHALAQVLSLPCSSSRGCSLCPACRIPTPITKSLRGWILVTPVIPAHPRGIQGFSVGLTQHCPHLQCP